MNYKTNAYPKGVSVIICTYNGAERISPTLLALKRQIIESDTKVEIILVNNKSTDNTVDIALETWDEFQIPLHIVLEPKPGLSSARNKGIQVAKYEYILFCDDDNHLFPDYLNILYQHFENNSDTIMIGGQGLPLTEITPPKWFSQYTESYASAPQGKTSGPAYTLYTAGLAIRKSYFVTLIELGFQFYLTDRLGKTLTSGADSELCYAFKMAGWQIWYEENMKFYHYIPKGRLNWNYLIGLHKGFSSSYIVLNQYKALIHSDTYKFNPLKELIYYAGICIKYYIPFKKAIEGDKIILHYHGWKIIARDLFWYWLTGKRKAHSLDKMYQKLQNNKFESNK